METLIYTSTYQDLYYTQKATLEVNIYLLTRDKDAFRKVQTLKGGLIPLWQALSHVYNSVTGYFGDKTGLTLDFFLKLEKILPIYEGQGKIMFEKFGYKDTQDTFKDTNSYLKGFRVVEEPVIEEIRRFERDTFFEQNTREEIDYVCHHDPITEPIVSPQLYRITGTALEATCTREFADEIIKLLMSLGHKLITIEKI